MPERVKSLIDKYSQEQLKEALGRFTARDNTSVSGTTNSGYVPAKERPVRDRSNTRIDDGPLGFIPVVGDILQGGQAVQDFFNGDYGKAALGAGLLFVPNTLEKAAKPVVHSFKNGFTRTLRHAPLRTVDLDDALLRPYKGQNFIHHDVPGEYVRDVLGGETRFMSPSLAVNRWGDYNDIYTPGFYGDHVFIGDRSMLDNSRLFRGDGLTPTVGELVYGYGSVPSQMRERVAEDIWKRMESENIGKNILTDVSELERLDLPVPDLYFEAKYHGTYPAERFRYGVFPEPTSHEGEKVIREYERRGLPIETYKAVGGNEGYNNKVETMLKVLNENQDLLFSGGGKFFRTNPDKNRIKQLADKVNRDSPADFVQRLLDTQRDYLVNPDGSFSTHELAYRDDGKGNATVYPLVQSVNSGNALHRFDDDMAYDRAVTLGDTLNMSTPDAKLFTENYKQEYPMYFQPELAPVGSLESAYNLAPPEARPLWTPYEGYAEEPVVEQPVVSLDPKKDAARRIMAVENSKNYVGGGWNAKTKRWYPHKSVEGGADTIAYGIKLSNGTPEAKLALQQGYLTDEQAESAVDTLVQRYYDAAKRVYDGKYGEGEWDKLSDKSQSILVDYSYNPGLAKFPSLMEGFHSGNMDMIRKNYKRYSGGKPLGRNKTLLEEIDTLESEYPIFRAEGGRLFKGGGKKTGVSLVNPKVIGQVIKQGALSLLPENVSKGLASVVSMTRGDLRGSPDIGSYYRYGVKEDWNPENGFLMSPSNQQKYLESIGYHKVDDGSYGMVNRAATELSKILGQPIPIYQLGDDDISPEEVELVSTDKSVVDPYFWRAPQNRMLRDAGSHPVALYKAKNGNDYYIKAWDLNDYGQHGNRTGGTKYGFKQILAEMYDHVGNPFVQRTGLIRVPTEEEVEAAHRPEFESRQAMIDYVNRTGKLIGEDDYASGGRIHIKPSKRGTFTAAASKHGKSVQEFASQVLAHKENYSPAMVKKANFARNAAKWHSEGGLLDRLRSTYGEREAIFEALRKVRAGSK